MAASAVSVFPGVRLLTIGDANGEIQRHQEQQALRLEARTGPDAACLALYSRMPPPPPPGPVLCGFIRANLKTSEEVIPDSPWRMLE
ncbi:UNVERIFIED_CONTAM: hypothetical protein K2H54_014591 [Gekko kuhli]